MDFSCYSLGQKVYATINCSRYVGFRGSTLMWHHCNQKNIPIGQIIFCFLHYKLCISIFHAFKKVQLLFNVFSMPSKFWRRSQTFSLSKNLLRTYCLSSSLKLWATSCKKLLKLSATIMHFLHLLFMWFSMDTSVAKTCWEIDFSMANARCLSHSALSLSWSLVCLHEPMDGQSLDPRWKHQIQM